MTDNPAAFDGVTYIPHQCAGRGIPYARNLGLRHATGRIVVFLDDDCTVDEGWIDALLAPFNDDRVVAVQGGETCPGHRTGVVGWCETLLGFPGGGLLRIYNAGYQILYTQDVMIYHQHRSPLKAPSSRALDSGAVIPRC